MIVERIEFLNRYHFLQESFQTATDFLRHTDLSALEAGCFALDGQRVTCTVVDRMLEAPPEIWEMHHKHIDIHAVIRGRETIRYCLEGKLPEYAVHDSESDSSVATGLTPEGEITLGAGQSVVLLPGEIHQTNCPAGDPDSVKKVIIKVLCGEETSPWREE